jgi:3-oxoacyl-[acyl-carrier protein] reductase
MNLGIKNKTALVTGSSRGIGKSCAISLSKEGANVVICGRDKQTLTASLSELKYINENTIGIVCDITDENGLSNVVSEINDTLGNIDILVNNVGGSVKKEGIEGTDISDMNKAFDLNLTPTIKLMQLVIPNMKSRKWGRIINISSVYGRELGGNLSYMTAKAALNSITKHSAIDLAKHGILINAVAPGPVSHPGGSWEKFQNQNSSEVVQNFIDENLPIGKFGWPEPIGDLVTFLASENSGFLTGTCINVDGGWSRSIN